MKARELENNIMDIKLFCKKGPIVTIAKPKKSPSKIGKPNKATGIKNLKFSSNVSEWDIQWVPDKKKPIPNK